MDPSVPARRRPDCRTPDLASWDVPQGPAARFQVVGADGRAWLLLRAPDGWSLEAGYD